MCLPFSDVAAFFSLRRRGPIKSDERVRFLFVKIEAFVARGRLKPLSRAIYYLYPCMTFTLCLVLGQSRSGGALPLVTIEMV